LFITNAVAAIAQKNDSILSGVYYWNKLEPIKKIQELEDKCWKEKHLLLSILKYMLQH
jgi:hypothetical protein